MLVVWLVKPAQDFTPVTLFERFQWEVRDQQVPAYILFFTIFEMVLYSYRHSLPFVGGPGGADRSDVPKNMREDYEHAGQLLEESERILSKNRARVERELPAAARDELREGLEQLREAMHAKPFEPGRVQRRLRTREPPGRPPAQPLAKGRVPRVRGIDRGRRRRGIAAAHLRGRSLQDPERLDAADAADPGSHLRQQAGLRPCDSVHEFAAIQQLTARARRRDGVRVPRPEPQQRAPRFHQARDRARGRHA